MPLPRKRKGTKTRAWRAFELEVAELYRVLGASGVDHDVDIAGNQIDVVASIPRIDGADVTRDIISCKCYNARAGVADVREWLQVFEACKKVNMADSAVIVSKLGFSRNAKKLAGEVGIRLRTIEELRWANVDLKPYLKDVVSEFAQEQVFEDNRYIDLRLQLEGSASVERADDVVARFMARRSTQLLTILGDYGAGKTTFCKHLFRVYADRYLSGDEKCPIPVYLNLRDYAGHLNLPGFVLEVLINLHNGRCQNYAKFRQLHEAGSILLILDAFDEMAARGNLQHTLANFAEIQKLCAGKANILLTCRTHFFKTPEEMHDVHVGTELFRASQQGNYEIAYVQPFSSEEIERFVRSTCKENADDALATISRTYDLMGLAQRPILLEMITHVIPQLADSDEPINNSTLYNEYVSQWLRRDDWRVGVSRDLRRKFTMAFAMQTYLADQPMFTLEEIRDAISRHFHHAAPEQLEDYERDIRLCTFIRRNEDRYEFVHKSFCEFFVSMQLYHDILADNKTRFESTVYSPEVLNFLAGQPNTKEARDTLRRWLGSSKQESVLAANLIRLLIVWEKSLRGALQQISLRQQVMQKTDVDSARFLSVDCEEITWRGGQWRNCASQKSQWRSCKWLDNPLCQMHFKEDRLDDAVFRNCDVDDVSFSDCIINGTRLELPSCTKLVFSGCEISASTIEADNARFLPGCVLDDVVIRGRIAELSGTQITGGALEDCDLLTTAFAGVSFIGTRFKNIKVKAGSLEHVSFRDLEFPPSFRVVGLENKFRWSKPPEFHSVAGLTDEVINLLKEKGARIK